ncbi:hypothetical protein BJY01DRAFT_201624 [Aspergillus pseudoustus]|uniref:Uncharacterized protein n=1 Tax=Aspergillus pseudoustus TaxID=1810923 RepID=A0ABR4L0A0_9EURO
MANAPEAGPCFAEGVFCSILRRIILEWGKKSAGLGLQIVDMRDEPSKSRNTYIVQTEYRNYILVLPGSVLTICPNIYCWTLIKSRKVRIYQMPS